MSDYYSSGSVPAFRASLTSATIRSEFTSVAAGFAKLPTFSGNGGKLVAVNSGATALEAVTSVTVAQGGTGATTLTDGGILLGSGTDAVTATARPTDGQVLVGAASGDPVLESGATLRTSIGLGTGDSPTFAALSLTAPLTVGNGGIGVATLADGGILLGSGTGAVTATARPTAGQVLVGASSGDPVLESGATLRTSLGLGTGDTPTFAGLALTADLPVAHGGTGRSTFTLGHVVLGNGTDGLQALDVTAKGSILVGDGVGNPVALAVGNDTHVLTADAAEASGLKWAAVGGGGGIGTMTTVKAAGTQVGGADIAVLDFSADFSVSETPDTEINVSIVAASATVAGKVELATIAEVNAGSDSTRAVTPGSLAGWTGSTNIASVGTITTGFWQGGTIAVANGGTGASSLAAGSVLLGSGTAAITAMTRLGTNEIIVGTSSGDPTAMSGATARSALGVVNNVTHTGEVTGSSALTIASDVVTNTKLSNMAQSTIKGRASGAGTGDPTDLTAAQVRTIINVENGATADQTAAEILTLIRTVDGAGSGLDADLLDGIASANFLRSNVSDTFTGTLSVVGNITASGDVTANTSDGRLKQSWMPLHGSLDKMATCQVGTFEWTDQARALNPMLSEARRLGVVAQEIQQRWPEAVAPAPFDVDPDTGLSISGENYLTVRYEMLVPVLWDAILELREEVAYLRATA